jgi:hypothetical protein
MVLSWEDYMRRRERRRRHDDMWDPEILICRSPSGAWSEGVSLAIQTRYQGTHDCSRE